MSPLDSELYGKLWNPLTYWQEYYAFRGEAFPADEWKIRSFVVRTLRSWGKRFERAVDLGCGPTVHNLFAFAPHVAVFDLLDYNSRNLEEIQKWRSGRADIDYTAYIDATLRAEGRRDVSATDMQHREAVTRAMVGELDVFDMRSPASVGRHQGYELATLFWSLEILSRLEQDWWLALESVKSVLAPDGRIILAVLLDSEGYSIRDLRYPCLNVSYDDVCEWLTAGGFRLDTAMHEFVTHGDLSGVPACANLERSSVLFAASRV